MTGNDLHRRLYSLDESDADGLRALAGQVAARAREGARAIVDLWERGASASACAYTCTHLAELAFSEMLGRAGTVAEPAMRAQLLELVVTQYLVFREYLLAVLAPTTPMEYLIIRRLVRPTADEADLFSTEERFLVLDEDAQTDEMRRWRISATWTSLFVPASGAAEP
jgi:hypothetical protein